MDIKLKYKDIKDIKNNTNWDTGAFTKGEQGALQTSVGYFAPSDTNWCYRVGIAKGKDGAPYFIVTVFGGVEGYIPIYL